MQGLHKKQLKQLKALRKKLHQHAEISDHEKMTADIIANWFTPLHPDQIIEKLGGYGLAFVYEGQKSGKTVLLRCELDALPIHETTKVSYQSSTPGVSHSCGHDGHMAILSSLGVLFSQQRPESGRIILLYQPAEETGQGARRILRDKKFRSLKPDLVFALHNLPGYPLGQVLIRKDTFYCASTGIVITLKGRTSHAAHPENGISPGFAVSELISALPRLSLKKELKNIYSLITITHVTIGERSLGIAPGDAVIMAALRAESDADLHMIAKLTEAHVHNTADMHSLQCYISWSETFPATVNHAQACDIIEHSASECGYSLRHLHTPLKVSEDFGEFTARYPGAILGIGSGENHPQLYNPGFDFPDRLIDIGCNMFMNIINKGVQS